MTSTQLFFTEAVLPKTYPQIIATEIRNTYIIEYGIIKEILEDGSVVVATMANTSKNDIHVVQCPLATFASANLTMSITPNIDDKVILLYPRRCIDEMFDVNKTDMLISGHCAGYNIFSGIAILLNQYQSNGHHNTMNFSDSGMALKLGYDAENETNNFSMTVAATGETKITTVDTPFEISNGKATVKVDAEGNITIDSKGGKVKINNDETSLYTALMKLYNKLNGGTVTTSGSPALHKIDSNQFTDFKTEIEKILKAE